VDTKKKTEDRSQESEGRRQKEKPKPQTKTLWNSADFTGLRGVSQNKSQKGNPKAENQNLEPTEDTEERTGKTFSATDFR
jgi:hypothetical protein